MEFPETGAGFFEELMKQRLDRDRILEELAWAARLTSEGEPIYLIMGVPMRRAPDGSPRLHVAVWTTDASLGNSLRNSLPEEDDPEELRVLRKEIADTLLALLEASNIKWCWVLEDRKEIVTRRDSGSSVAWFTGKRILVLGCGALGSWISEIGARANPSFMHLVDNSLVKPGVLARQNYRLDDIGSNKARALGGRLRSIIHGGIVQHFEREAHGFITEDFDRINDYDVVLDCTAPNILQMKIERDWERFRRRTPLLISMIIDAKGRRSLCVVVSPGSSSGIWSAYVQLKQRLCLEVNRTDLVSAFYSDLATKDMFQPEPGCSEPTFSGSTADVLGLTATALDLALTKPSQRWSRYRNSPLCERTRRS
jgi:ThiF family